MAPPPKLKETKMSKSLIVLQALRDNYESTMTFADGVKWGSVYLDNARPEGMSDKSFRSCLSSLSAAGQYKPQGDDCFGYVKLEG
jgi:hypothetical protein